MPAPPMPTKWSRRPSHGCSPSSAPVAASTSPATRAAARRRQEGGGGGGIGRRGGVPERAEAHGRAALAKRSRELLEAPPAGEVDHPGSPRAAECLDGGKVQAARAKAPAEDEQARSL